MRFIPLRGTRPLLPVIAAAILVTGSCSHPVDDNIRDLTTTPDGVEAYLLVSPGERLDALDDHTVLYAMDPSGKPIGKIQAPGIRRARAIATKDSVSFTSADQVIRTTPTKKLTHPIDEFMVEGGAIEPTTGETTYWFNTGPKDGQYVTSYVTMSPDGRTTTGSIPGTLFGAAYCGGKLYMIARPLQTRSPREYSAILYSVDPNGIPSELNRWNDTSRFVPTTRTFMCTNRENRLWGVYYRYVDGESVNKPMVSVTIETTAPYTQTRQDLRNTDDIWWQTSDMARTVVDDSLVWVSARGDVATLSDKGELTRRWKIDAPVESRKSIQGTSLRYVDYSGDVPLYSRFDLLSGRRIVGPLALEWLRDIIGKPTESRRSYYIVADIAAAR